MQGKRDMNILMHIQDYCEENKYTINTFGKNYETLGKDNISQ